ncbi:MAG: tetratricopeptide repeat protein, partial [Myxococcales bacterium]|nr:tetratricopeptide repeat protein [Myxococcales bacterium]
EKPAKVEKAAKAEKPAKVEKPAKAESAAEAPAAPAPHKQVGHVATRMVDDALWALIGKKPDEPAPEAEGEAKKAPVRAKLRVKDAPAEGGAAPVAEGKGPMVVRTSAQFGAWTRVATILVIAVAAGFVGHWVALASSGPGPEVASEELKGVATDLERGGLASLLAAEDQIAVLTRGNPSLAPLLDAAMAEVYARRYARFGEDPQMRQRAQGKLHDIALQPVTVEQLAAQTLLSTSAVQRSAIRDRLVAARHEYPDSPKTFVVEGWSYLMDGARAKAIEAFYAAQALHPQHRAALLAIARWHAQAQAYGAAFTFFDKLQEKYPDDVEVAIERFVLGKLSGADPAEAEAVSTLAGLVREEIPQVAKDETGRAALAFAVPLLAQGQLTEGVVELEKAAAAFENSPVFKRAMGDAFLAIGEFGRAKKQYERARELRPDDAGIRVGLARAQLGLDGRLKVDLADAGAAIQAARAKGEGSDGHADLPYGRLELVPGRFELLAFTPKGEVFPEDTYAALAGRLEGAALDKALAAASLVALGEARISGGDCDAATEYFQKANALEPTPAARFGLGRCRLVREDWAGAESALKKALDEDPDHVPGWLMLARARRAQGNLIGAIEALERFEGKGPVAPDALAMLGALRMSRGDWEGALRNLNAAVAIMPGDAEAQLNRGEVLHRLGRTGEATEAFRAALEADPRLAKVGKARGTTAIQLMYLGMLETDQSSRRAVSLLKDAVSFEDAPLEAQFYLGRALIGNKRTKKEGKRALEKYVRVGPDGPLRQEAERLLRRR